jgi:hypothetical protein
VYWTYRQAMDRARWGEHQQVIRELARRYGVRYTDFLEDGRFERADFYNDDHLNEDGAAKFTKILDAEVLAPMR